MSVRAAAVPKGVEAMPDVTTGSRAAGWWGMVFFIATEATLFALLFASYFYLRFKSGTEWPPAGIEPPSLRLPIMMSIVLLSSSFPMHLAEGHQTLGTSVLDAEPDQVMGMPGETHAPLLLTLALTALFFAFLFDAWLVASVAGAGAIAALIQWLWPHPHAESHT